jgi:hypothetical protein
MPGKLKGKKGGILMLWWIVIAFICGGIASITAKNKGRSEFGWGLSAFLIGPFALIVFLLPAIADGKNLKKCPYCSELIKVSAIKCKYCRSQLNNNPVQPESKKTDICKICGSTELRYNIKDGGVSELWCSICNKKVG